MFYRLPDIYSHHLPRSQRTMLRVAAVMVACIAPLCLLLLLLFGDGHFSPLWLAAIGIASLLLGAGLWRGVPNATVLLVFLLAVLTMLSIALGVRAAEASHWRAFAVCGGIVAGCAPYLKEFFLLCMKK